MYHTVNWIDYLKQHQTHVITKQTLTYTHMSNLLGYFGNDNLGGGKLVLCSWTLTRKGESLTLDTAHCKALQSIVVHTYLLLTPDGVGVRTNLVCMGMYQTLPFSENLAT